MTTSPGACPSSTPAPGGVPLTLPDDAKSAASGQSTADFFKYVSQAYRQRQDDAAAAQRQRDATSAANSTDATTQASATTDPSDSSNDTKTDPKTRKKKTDDTDTAVSSMAMALMLPQTLTASEQKFIAAKATAQQSGQIDEAITNDPATDAKGIEWLSGKDPKLTVATGDAKTTQTAATGAKITSAENSALVAATEKKGLLILSEKPQGVVDKTGKLLLKGFEAVQNGDGAGVASLKERMKFATEKNEIAEQGDKSSTAVASVSSAGEGAGADLSEDTNSELAGGKKETAEPVMNLDFSAKVASFAVEHNSTETVQPAQVAAHVERVAHLVGQEAMTIRQAGASSVAVSLKLDSKTEISLELTNRNGQVQAAIRVEKGDLSNMAGHWGDLQASLAKQNVQLADFDGKSSNNLFSGNDTGSSSHDQSSLFGGNSQESRFQNRNLTNETTATATVTKPATKTKSKSLAQGWESWA